MTDICVVMENCDGFVIKKKSINKLWREDDAKILVMDLRLLCNGFCDGKQSITSPLLNKL